MLSIVIFVNRPYSYYNCSNIGFLEGLQTSSKKSFLFVVCFGFGIWLFRGKLFVEYLA